MKHRPGSGWTVNQMPSTRRPGCLPLAPLACPFATAGRATPRQRRDNTYRRRHVKALTPRLPALVPAARQPAGLGGAAIRATASPRETALYTGTGSNAAALANWCPGGMAASPSCTAGEIGDGDRVRRWLPPPPRPTSRFRQEAHMEISSNPANANLYSCASPRERVPWSETERRTLSCEERNFFSVLERNPSAAN